MKRARPVDVRRQRRRAFVVAVTLPLLVLSACSDGDNESLPATTGSSTAGRATTTTAPPATSSTGSGGSSPSDAPSSTVPVAGAPGSGDQEIIDRYVGYWHARFNANTGTPDPNAPQLAEFATGRQLEQVRTETQGNLDDGLSFRAATKPANIQRVTVVSVDGDHAVVQECVVTDDVVFRRGSGEVVDDAVATHNARGELDRVDGVWRVSAVSLVQKWDGVAGCALGS
jgi:hypothetical protein